MTWKLQLQQIIRDQIPYAFLIKDPATGATSRCSLSEQPFAEAMGYITEFVEMRMRSAYFEGYAKGAEDTCFDVNQTQAKTASEIFVFDKDLSRYGAEKAWLG